MNTISADEVKVPVDVPSEFRETYVNNFLQMTHDTGRLMLFAGDQKVEHLNDDFYGEKISSEDSDPEHLFQIASQAKIGVFAAQLGFISQYAMDYKEIPYLIKLNSKTPLVKTADMEPVSLEWVDMDQVIEFKQNSGLHILGVGYTVYVGSEHESEMLREAAQIIYEAHQNGLLTVIWAYPRGKAVPNEKDPHVIAGAAGVVASLGADFVKVNYPKKEGISSAEALQEAVKAAGRTRLVCAGGSSVDAAAFLQTLYDQIHISGASGNATGRNIHQRPLDEAVRLANAIYAITVEDRSVEEALLIYKG
jgi:fructose-bisphosphate aldolase/6-deoxy-5-ketofructose 1-phosphate synthase